MWVAFSFVCIVMSAMLFRFRGGGVVPLPGEKSDNKHTQVRRVVCAVCYGLLALNLWAGIIAFASFLTGWGFPVSAAIGKRKSTDWEAEWGPLDTTSLWLTHKIFGTYDAQRYGVIWLSLHGLLFGGLAAAVTLSPAWLLLAGFGLCYRLTRHWEYGELAAGALWGLATTIYLLGV